MRSWQRFWTVRLAPSPLTGAVATGDDRPAEVATAGLPVRELGLGRSKGAGLEGMHLGVDEKMMTGSFVWKSGHD